MLSSIDTNRPAFKAGQKFEPRSLPSLEELRKTVTAPAIDIAKDEIIRRPSFKPEGIKPRTALGVSDIESQLTREQGLKVRFGDETLRQLFDVKVPVRGPDGKVLKDASGKPVMTTKRLNFGRLAGTIGERFDRLTQDIENEEFKTRVGISDDFKTSIGLDIHNILNVAIASRDFGQLTLQRLGIMSQAITELGISTSPAAAGLPVIDGRFITQAKFLQEGVGGLVLMFLISKALKTPGLAFDRPAINTVNNNLMSIQQIINAFERAEVLDADTSKFYPNLTMARNAVAVELGQAGDILPFTGEEKIPEQLPVAGRILLPAAATQEQLPTLSAEQIEAVALASKELGQTVRTVPALEPGIEESE